MEVYQLDEKKQIIKWYYQNNTVRRIRDLFVTTFEGRPTPSLSTIHRIIQNFERHGCLSPTCHKKPPVPNDDREMLQIMVCATALEEPTLSSRKIADAVNSSATTVRRILKKNGYRSYKVKKTHQILPTDNIRRMEFCEAAMEKINRNENFTRNVVFTDESTFPLLGRHNPSRVRYWSRENLHRFFTLRTQYPQKLNVWAGLLGEHMLGPFFIEGNLNGPKYLTLLQQQIVPEIRRLTGERFGDIWFQQDGCPAHNNGLVQQYLNNTFPNRLITGRGTILWPARSPDLSPNDFFLWGYCKSAIYGHENMPNTLEDLRAKISEVFQSITPNMLSNVRRGFYNRLGYCLAQEGGLFEHLI